MNNTPLRYPGGKSIMTPFFQDLIKYNSFKNVIYSEPYGGGAGAAINLLLNNDVDAIQINDASVGIFSFWKALLTKGEKFLEKVENTPVNLNEWQIQRRIFKNSSAPTFELGFSTFFLSRTNRSGILAAGPIGGQDEKAQQRAKYKIDCRFNKEHLLERLKRIVENRNRINVFNLDALHFLRQIKDKKNSLVYLDPPYYTQGKALYLNYYQHEDHVKLSNYLRRSASFNWLLSYDNVPEILELYADHPLYQFVLNYTAQGSKKGVELFTHSSNILLPDNLKINKKKKADSIEILQIVS
ncbi:MAG TPA: DNA adenine methylase [Flavisolibacter sp.]|jgi:DNA adenine methylase|nr:DNA adenine methylase [Flavisolibacter sp.]